jgi:hypothetical protein
MRLARFERVGTANLTGSLALDTRGVTPAPRGSPPSPAPGTPDRTRRRLW